MTDGELDPILAAAYAADRAAVADAVARAGIARDRLLVAVLARTARGRTVAAVRAPRRWRWALAATAIAGLAIGYAAARLTAPTLAPPLAPAPAVPAAPAAAASVDAGPLADAAPALPPDAAPAPAPRPAAAPAHAPGTDNAETLLLDQARAALRRHLPADALVALQQHAHAFPTGQLREERDVLWIETALAQDRRADANELIAAYLDRYPSGSLRARVAELQRELDRLITHGR